MSAFVNSTNKLSKTTGLVAANSDYTCVGWWRNKSTPGITDYKAAVIFKNAGYTAWAGIFSDVGANTWDVQVSNGVTALATPPVTMVQDHWHPLAYVRSGNNHSFYEGGRLLGTVTVDITAVTWLDQVIGYDGFAVTNFDVFGFREYNTAKTLAEIIVEWNSVTPVLTPVTNTPLQDNANATVGTSWTNTGVTFPNVSPVQVPLTNTSAVNAYNIPSLPSDIVQVATAGGGTNSDLWFLLTAPSPSQVIGTWGFSKNIGSGYRPFAKPYIDATTQLLSITGQNKPIQFPVDAGNTYLMRFQSNGNTTPASIQILTQVAPITQFTAGEIMVPDDTPGFPISMVSASTNFTALNFKTNVAASEAGAILRNNNLILIADDLSGNDTFNLYDTGLNLLSVISNLIPGTSTTPRAGSNPTAQIIYFSQNGDATHHARWSTINSVGVQGAIVDLPNLGVSALCGNNSNTILYYSGALGVLNSNIKRWDIPGGAALTDFLPTVTNYQVGDILMMPDETILISYFKLSLTRDFFVRRYDSAATLLNTYSFGTDHSSSIPRLAYALDNTSFWVWTHAASDPGKSVFRNILMSDGSTLVTVNQIEFTQGVYQAAETATPLARFGNSNSCPFFLFSNSAFGGIYIIVPGKTDDTVVSGGAPVNLKKPDPTWRTGMLGL